MRTDLEMRPGDGIVHYRHGLIYLLVDADLDHVATDEEREFLRTLGYELLLLGDRLTKQFLKTFLDEFEVSSVEERHEPDGTLRFVVSDSARRYQLVVPPEPS